jgi:hypothetical protein
MRIVGGAVRCLRAPVGLDLELDNDAIGVEEPRNWKEVAVDMTVGECGIHCADGNVFLVMSCLLVGKRGDAVLKVFGVVNGDSYGDL